MTFSGPRMLQTASCQMEEDCQGRVWGQDQVCPDRLHLKETGVRAPDLEFWMPRTSPHWKSIYLMGASTWSSLVMPQTSRESSSYWHVVLVEDKEPSPTYTPCGWWTPSLATYTVFIKIPQCSRYEASVFMKEMWMESNFVLTRCMRSMQAMRRSGDTSSESDIFQQIWKICSRRIKSHFITIMIK